MARRSRRLILCFYDILFFIIVSLSYLGLVNFCGPYLKYRNDWGFWAVSAIMLVSWLLFRFFFGIYKSIWRYVQLSLSLCLLLADIAAGAVAVIPAVIIGGSFAAWHTGIVMMGFAILSLLARFIYQYLYRKKNIVENDAVRKTRVAIVGAGQMGVLLAEDLLYRKDSRYVPMCFIDKDSRKMGNKISGMMVYPMNERTISALKAYNVEEIFVAITALSSESAAKIFDFFSSFGYKVKISDAPMKDMGEDSGESKRHIIRDFKIEDLLFREQIDFSENDLGSYYGGKSILVTGGGGSIGSEICRQLAVLKPKKLIIFDIYENNAYDIQQELRRKYGDTLDLSVEIGSVRDVQRLDMLFDTYRPDVVFHAAAHKHVPLMEHSGAEAIKNNVLGTYNVANVAEKYGVGKFILISTDKAVNPTNVMGATKRMCEMVIQCRTDSKTEFAAVRFGNVLGSNGSVIPLFKAQIAQGGPITITDKKIIRYFMTIPEASRLVMQAGAMAKKGELFVLDMGNPVKIYDLAVNMIRLSGLEPEKDIKIVEIGLRPGEKLYEELLIKKEKLSKTENSKIFIETDEPLTRSQVEDKLDILRDAVKEAEMSKNVELIKAAIKNVVPTFVEPEKINAVAEQAEEMKKANAI